MLDKGGAKRPVVLGCAISAVGFGLWANKVTDLHLNAQIWYIIIAGFGLGMMLGPSSTDAVNRAGRLSYGEATGITQTVRNYAASLGLAVLGTIQVSVFRSHLTTSLMAQLTRRPNSAAQSPRLGREAATVRLPASMSSSEWTSRTRHKWSFTACAAIMAFAGLIGLRGLRRGVQQEVPNVSAGRERGLVQDRPFVDGLEG